MRKKLQTLREGAGYTQQTFSERLGVSRSHYAQIESGDKNPSLKLSLKIKQALGYPYDDLFFNPKRPVSRHWREMMTPKANIWRFLVNILTERRHGINA